MTTKRSEGGVQGKCWLWPDHAISKAESRELREEHNAIVNSHSALLEAAEVARDVMYGEGYRGGNNPLMAKVEAAIRAAKEGSA